jgi:hypothetical protein
MIKTPLKLAIMVTFFIILAQMSQFYNDSTDYIDTYQPHRGTRQGTPLTTNVICAILVSDIKTPEA